MISVLLFLMLGDVSKPVTLRYLKPAGGKFVLESEVTTQEIKGGSTYVSKTVRGNHTLTLTIVRDDRGGVRTAEIVTDSAGTTQAARLERAGEAFRLTRDGTKEEVKGPADSVITSAPDWSDIFELVRRHDSKKRGKQQFAGVWFHPKQATLTPAFIIERTGSDTVTVKDAEVALDRYEIRLRASTNRVWALPGGVVVKILPVAEKAAPIVLEGYEEVTRELK